MQSQSQLKAIYKDAAEIISDNCDCTLFLSGRGKNAKEIAEVLGKETIDSYNQSENMLSAVSPEVSPKEKAVLRITKYLLPV